MFGFRRQFKITMVLVFFMALVIGINLPDSNADSLKPKKKKEAPSPTVSQTGAPPVITGFLNSRGESTPAALPGETISIQGNNFVTVSGQLVSVRINGIQIPNPNILLSTPTLLRVLIPTTMPIGISSLVVTTGFGQTSRDIVIQKRVFIGNIQIPQQGRVGQSYTGSFVASSGTPVTSIVPNQGGITPIDTFLRLSILSGSLPPGLSFQSLQSADGLTRAQFTIAGTPTTPGTYQVTVQVDEICNCLIVASTPVFIGLGVGIPATIGITITPQQTCQYSISPSSQSFSGSGGAGSFQVIPSTSSGCAAWTASANQSWIQITSGIGQGTGTVGYTVEPNNSASSRQGIITVAGQTHTVSQSSNNVCTYSIRPESQSVPAAGGNFNIDVTPSAAFGCSSWSAAPSQPWIRILQGTTGIGAGNVAYSIDANTGSERRQGSISVAGRILSITQDPGGGSTCSLSISPTSETVSADGGSLSLSITTPTNCAWSISSNASWASINGPTSGSGSRTLPIQVQSNPDTAQRSATISVSSGQTTSTLTITQPGRTTTSCTLAVSPTDLRFPPSGGQGSFSLSIGSGCAWTVSNDVGWIQITSSTFGSGTQTITFRVEQHIGLGMRQGKITATGPNGTAALQIVQSGSAATASNLTATLNGSAVQLAWQAPPQNPLSNTELVKPASFPPNPRLVEPNQLRGFRIDSPTAFVFGQQLTPRTYPATLKSVLFLSAHKLFGNTSAIGARFRLYVFTANTGADFARDQVQNLETYDVTIQKEPSTQLINETEDYNEYPIRDLTIARGSFFVGLQFLDGGTSQVAAIGSDFWYGFISNQSSTAFVSVNGGATFIGTGIALTLNGSRTLADFPFMGRVEVPGGSGNSAQSLTGYNIYRSRTSPVALTPENRINQVGASTTSFSDTLPSGNENQQFFYTLTAVYGNGTESGPSNDATAVPPRIASDPPTVALRSGQSREGTIQAPPSRPPVFSETQYTIEVPSGATSLRIQITGDQDVDLFARFGERVDFSGGRPVADFRSESQNNAETITILPTSSPALRPGTYFIGVSNFSNSQVRFTLVATVEGGTSTQPTTRTYSSQQRVQIPDNDSRGITSEINVPDGFTIQNTRLSVNITHPFRGDIEIDLVGPSGKTFRVKNSDEDRGDNIDLDLNISDFNSERSDGVWRLVVKDLFRGQTGALTRWALEFTVGQGQLPGGDPGSITLSSDSLTRSISFGGGTATFPISIQRNNFTGPVSFSLAISGTPTGIVGRVDPPSTTGGFVNVVFTSTNLESQKAIQLRGEGQGINAASLGLVVHPSSFSPSPFWEPGTGIISPTIGNQNPDTSLGTVRVRRPTTPPNFPQVANYGIRINFNLPGVPFTVVPSATVPTALNNPLFDPIGFDPSNFVVNGVRDFRVAVTYTSTTSLGTYRMPLQISVNGAPPAQIGIITLIVE